TCPTRAWNKKMRTPSDSTAKARIGTKTRSCTAMKNWTRRLSRARARPMSPTGNTNGIASRKLGPNRMPTTSPGTTAKTSCPPERDPSHDAPAHARADYAEMIPQGADAQAEDNHQADENGRHRAGNRVARPEEQKNDHGADDQLQRQVEGERGEPLQTLEDSARDCHLPDQGDGETEDEDRDRRAEVLEGGDAPREQRRQQHEEERRDGN